MKNITDRINQVKDEAQSILNASRDEWEGRYAEYASTIIKKLEQIKKHKSQFSQWSPLYLYSTVGKPESFQLRYKGQAVAALAFQNHALLLKRTEEIINSTHKYFEYTSTWKDIPWRSKDATDFRKHFQKLTAALEPRQLEHKYESMILTEMEKQKRESKFSGTYHGIQPVKLAGVSRFQLPTPLCASKPNEISYSGAYGGGIDILARISSGAATNLSVFELKAPTISDTQQTIEQGLAYTIFLRELLRSISGAEWYRIFGYKGLIPQKLQLNCIALMTHDTATPVFSKKIINIESDEIHLHHMFYQEQPNGISITETSLPTYEQKTHS